MAAQNLRVVGDRIEQLLDELHATADPVTLRAAPRTCCGWSPSSTAAGSNGCVGSSARSAPELIDRLVDDELVASLLRRARPASRRPRPHRVEQALESVRPVPRDPRRRRRAARRRRRRRRGAPAAARQLRRLPVVGGDAAHAVERAIIEAAPEIVIIDVEQPSADGRRTAGDRHAGDPRPQAGAGFESCPTEVRGAMSGEPARRLAARSAERAARAAPAAGRDAASSAPSRSVRRARPPRRPRGPQPHVRVPRLLPAVHAGRRRRQALRAVPERYLAFPDFRLSRCAVGCAADPRERRVLLPQLDARAGRRVLPEPGRRDRVAAPARHVGRARVGATRAGDAAARRRGVPRARRARRRRGRVLPRADRRLLRAGRRAAHAVAGLRRRAARPTQALDAVLRPGAERGRR